jgi:hypothetical protein
MVARIGANNEAVQWAAQIALVRMCRETFKLSADVSYGADRRVIAEDRAAVQASRAKVGARIVDVTV